MRASADALTLHVLKTYEAADRLVPAEEEEPVDVSATLDELDNWNPAERNARAVANAAKADELAANLARIRAGN